MMRDRFHYTPIVSSVRKNMSFQDVGMSLRRKAQTHLTKMFRKQKKLFFGLVLHLTDQMGAFSESALNSTSFQCILTPFQLLHEE